MMDDTEVVVNLWVLQLVSNVTVFCNMRQWEKIVQIFIPLEQEDSAYDMKSSALRNV